MSEGNTGICMSCGTHGEVFYVGRHHIAKYAVHACSTCRRVQRNRTTKLKVPWRTRSAVDTDIREVFAEAGVTPLVGLEGFWNGVDDVREKDEELALRLELLSEEWEVSIQNG